MSISQDLYPSEEDYLYEEEVLRNPNSLKLWWRYLIARSEAPFKKRAIIYERALKALPGSYKLWHAYLRERLEIVRNLPITHSQYQTLNNTFERALATMHKMPRIWIMYLQSLTQQKLITKTRRTFDRALCALPVTQHDRIWEYYLIFVSQKGVPIETFECTGAERLAGVLNDDQFFSIKGKTKHRLWLELCDLLTQHASEISGLNVDAIIRGGIRKFTDEFEESMLSIKMETLDDSDDEDNEENGEEEEEEEEDDRLDIEKLRKRIDKFWLKDDKDVDLRLARLEYLMDRRPELANSVLLRQNPHNVEQWHRRIKLFEGNPTKQILTYTEAVRTVDPMKAVGKPHTLWVAFAKLYESHKDVSNARVIFDKAVQVNYKTVDHLASVWCEWAEMELRHKNFKGALELMRRATELSALPAKLGTNNFLSVMNLKKMISVSDGVDSLAADGNEPVQIKLHKSLRLWTFYVDLEESLGSLESTRAVYERILDLRIATPQIIINYAMLLEDNKYFEDAFKVYERGVKIFKYPHVKDIWVTYLSKFVKRYGKSKLERARELFEHAVEMAPAESVKPLYLQYAKLEEDYGLAKRAMRVYDQATKAVPANEKLGMYEIYIARAAEIFGVPKTREIYEQAIESGLPDKDVKVMCLKYAELEKSLGEIDRSRALYKHASQFADPRTDPDFWNKWHEFEVQHGNEDTFREMLRVKRSVSASYSQTHFILPEYLMQKDQMQTLEEAKDVLKKAGVADDEMAALERQLIPTANETTANDTGRRLGFVSAGLQNGGETTANKEDIELPEDSDSEDDEKVEIAQKDVPTAVFGGLVRKRDETDEDVENGKSTVTESKDNDGHLGALERIKRMRRGA
ncbi:Pre-splicing factor SYF1 [Sesamum angolense]|uniref:Pre-mRNA-splicing factor SYF1 n=1 Tax=Sesamum angolense TaxID=2727404 RepID=A0AAE2BTD4_9LAMI|nr:Pre-splicing factor SYF1 [Sesamum angolense]